jgi:uncharacterized phage infection (PIP) family protein YhgE
MRRVIYLGLGVLEFVVAGVLLVLAWQLPGPTQVDDGAGRVERVSRQASAEVGRLRARLAAVRKRSPEMKELADRLQKQMDLAVAGVQNQKIDFEAVAALHGALGDAAHGLDDFAAVADPDFVKQLAAGMKGTADFLEERLTPTAQEAAAQLERSTGTLKADAERLRDLVKAAPLDLKAVQQVHDSLGEFTEGLDRLAPTSRLENVAAMRDGFKGLESSLSSGAEQVERLSNFTYPVVTFNGLKPKVENRMFWPEGKNIAEGMRQASRGASAAAKEMAALNDDLPRIRKSIDQTRKAAQATRDALGQALKHQDKIEPLLKNVPEHAARLADELPQLGADLARVLRDTSKLKDVAGVLRQAEKGLNVTAERWPEFRKNLGKSSTLLRTTQTHLKTALDNRQQYEATFNNTVELARSFSAALPLLTEQLGDELAEEEKSLNDLSARLDEVSDGIAPAAQSASGVLQTTRLLLVLGAVVFALHGVALLIGERPRQAEKGAA